MKKSIVVLLCLLFASCSNYLRKEEVKDINQCLTQYKKSIHSTEIYYNVNPSYKLLMEGNYKISKAEIIERNGKIVSLQSDFVHFDKPGRIIGNYFFNMYTEGGKTFIYITFKEKNKWYMIKFNSN